jgi:hypothetical protein
MRKVGLDFYGDDSLVHGVANATQNLYLHYAIPALKGRAKFMSSLRDEYAIL